MLSAYELDIVQTASLTLTNAHYARILISSEPIISTYTSKYENFDYVFSSSFWGFSVRRNILEPQNIELPQELQNINNFLNIFTKNLHVMAVAESALILGNVRLNEWIQYNHDLMSTITPDIWQLAFADFTCQVKQSHFFQEKQDMLDAFYNHMQSFTSYNHIDIIM